MEGGTRRGRVGFGLAVAVIAAIVTLPTWWKDTEEVVTEWASFSLSVPNELLRLLLFLALALVAAWLVSPAAEAAVIFAWKRRMDQSRRSKEELARRAEREVELERQQRDIGDFLSANLLSGDLVAALTALTEGPTPLDLRLASVLRDAGVFERVTEAGWSREGTHHAVYRLTAAARPIVVGVLRVLSEQEAAEGGG